MNRFNHIREDFAVDSNTHPEAIESELDIIQLRKYCARYSEEVKTLQTILPTVRLGIFQLNQSTFETKFLPVVANLLTILQVHILDRSVQMVGDLDLKANGILSKLTENPDKTIDWLMYIRYLDECSGQIDQLIINIDYTFECFILMEEYEISVKEEHKESQKSK